MALDLSRVKEREALPSRREPHWQRVRPGCFLGYRPSSREGAGTWIARAYDEDRRKYRLQSLGDFPGVPAREQFTIAKREAEQFAERVESGGHQRTPIETVEDACKEYAKANGEAASRFRRYVYADPIGKVKLTKLRRHHVQEWRTRLQRTPAKGKQGEMLSASSVGRQSAMLRAALAQVLAPGAPGTDAAWQEPLRRSKHDDRQRTLYLDREQRRRLLQHLRKEAEPFVRTLCLLPLRPGAVADLTVADFDKRTRELTIGKDKDGKPRRILLPPAAAAHLLEQSKDKLPAAPLFSRADGRTWTRDSWKDPIAEAVRAAELPAGATAYTLRHSTITDLVQAGLPLLTIAQVSGTSVEMIERHYGHLNAKAAADALAGLAL
ncbi:tyrosine-type recombinase/integrase [Sphingomonas arenae]|uniref:tyrosine-type recombinase/integrase n=1 Tax=Sphingomonas arenae TaxID=2812555 RepID=UPI0019674D0E|nr:tyrosine-type recombinase/integrase [Sphingomonas arenae]